MAKKTKTHGKCLTKKTVRSAVTGKPVKRCKKFAKVKSTAKTKK